MRRNAPSRRTGSLACIFFLLCWTTAALAQSPEAKRIAELEERVARLERALTELTNAKSAAATAQTLLDDLPVTPAPARPAPVKQERVNQELLPNLGKIGAATSFFTGLHSGPFALRRGSYFGGAIELPLRNAPGGRLLYEISTGLSRSTSPTTVTSNVAQVANLAALAALNPAGGGTNIAAAIAGTGPAPFPVTVRADTNLQLLQVTPFALKYVHTRADRLRLRPYVQAGLGAYVAITNQVTNPAATTGLRADAALPPDLRLAFDALFANRAPFGGALIGGQLTQARELTERGIPAGQGGIEIGLQTGTGLEWRMSRTLSLSVDVRWNRLANGVSYFNSATRWGWHF